MSSDDNKALVRRFYGEIDQGNLDAIDELVAENYLDHSPPPFPGIGPGREGLKQSFGMFWDATPGRHEIEDQVAEGDKVVVRQRHPGPPAATWRPAEAIANGHRRPRELSEASMPPHRSP
jgi:ketosteroid isomerase-like protein